jgi:hypothetical protein
LKTISKLGLPLLLLLALAGCGSLSAPPLPTFTATLSAPVKTSTVACSLLTKAEAESILGLPVNDPNTMSSTDKQGAKDEATTCRYTEKVATPLATPNPLDKQITLIAINHPTVAEATQVFAETQGHYGTRAEPVGGIGERAFWLTADKQLNVLRGDVWLIIIADSATEKGSLESARQVASIALSKLQ